jgi:hypothetical protein
MTGGLVGSIDEEVEALGMRHRIVSRRTSLVAIAEEPSIDPSAPRRRQRLAVEMPYGVSAEGVGVGFEGIGFMATVMAKQTMAMPRMARDLGVLKQIARRMDPPVRDFLSVLADQLRELRRKLDKGPLHRGLWKRLDDALARIATVPIRETLAVAAEHRAERDQLEELDEPDRDRVKEMARRLRERSSAQVTDSDLATEIDALIALLDRMSQRRIQWRERLEEIASLRDSGSA